MIILFLLISRWRLTDEAILTGICALGLVLIAGVFDLAHRAGAI